MATIECNHLFCGIHQELSQPAYDEAFEEFKRLHLSGATGDFRLQISDRSGESNVLVTVWRSSDVSVAGWEKTIETDACPLKYRYTKAFNPPTATPSELIKAAKDFLLSSPGHA
jgi:hypothetical protein